ncbi:restriction endonuclease subunit S, partial [Paenibacillus polymyxa]|uniref:restriction endonuclease subunit S n=1 Tax=Paenibacillus polymyxa TaxID=1406 RepID=UPI003EBEA6F3
SILNPEYLVYCLNSPNIKKMMLNLMTGSAIKRLTLTKIKKGIIPLPPIEEQNKIVDILKTLFKNEEVQANNIPDKELGRIKQSILMKAFRGELGTNNSSEKSSIDLLIQELKEESN